MLQEMKLRNCRQLVKLKCKAARFGGCGADFPLSAETWELYLYLARIYFCDDIKS